MSRLWKSNRSRSDQKGQIAIFIALIFQIIFLFFAMVINIGLLVHHKINLQNSADLAAYYGAMKQAQVMNAMGHINYQIRQSYKLLTWRYRVLGTSGVMPNTDPPNAHPVLKTDGAASGTNGGQIIGSDEDGIPGNFSGSSALTQFYSAPAFCVAFRPFMEIPTGENTCRNAEGQTIAALQVPPIIAGFIGAAHTAAQVTRMANVSQENRCKYAGPYNYIMLARFVTAYNLDAGDRKLLMTKLAMGLSKSSDDFTDIEGESGKAGITTTLKNNLSPSNNNASLKIKVFNGLGHNACAGGNIGSTSFVTPKWVQDIGIFPWSAYKNCLYSGGSNFTVYNIHQPPTVGVPPELQSDVAYLKDWATPPESGPYRTTLGMEKNPWCMEYVGVSVESEPDIPFAPAKIKLKATAFAKPFGGRIGPWYGKRFPRTSPKSDGTYDLRVDRLTPIRCESYSQCASTSRAESQVTNYSRFPGDEAGLMNRMMMAQYGKSIYDLGTPSFEQWRGIEVSAAGRGGEWDPLAWNILNPGDQRMRDLEISAVIPDIFDLTYYSIEPDFYRTYVEGRLEKYITKNPIASGIGIRGDIGSRKDGSIPGIGRPYKTFSIKDQLTLTANSVSRGPSSNSYGVDFSGKVRHTIFPTNAATNFQEVLTGWIPTTNLDDYSIDPKRFGVCSLPIDPSKPAAGGSCIHGGRTGYSVKIVSSDYLKTALPLGGEGEAPGKILNPPPDDF